MKKIYALYGLAWCAALSFLVYFYQTPSFSAPFSGQSDDYNQSLFLRGTIVKAEGAHYTVRVLNEKKDFTVATELNDYFFHDDYRVGDKVTLYVSTKEDSSFRYEIADYYHLDGLFFVFALFCLLAILVAGRKGFFSIFSILISLVFFYGAILGAVNLQIPVTACILFYVFFITVLTIPLIHGFNRKSLSAILAVNAGYLLSLGLAYLFVSLARIGMAPSEEFRTLLGQFPETNLYPLLFSSLFLGAAGALIDVAVSISSAIFEGLREHPRITFSKACRIGMNVGRDILGSMINTLLLAYLASSLPFLFLMALSGHGDLAEFLNYDFVALELVRIFIGAAAIILLIPIASSSASYFLLYKTNAEKKMAAV